MSIFNTSTTPVAILGAPTQNKALLMYARAVYGALLDNPSFPTPNPPLSVFAANIDAFEDAETKAASRAKGAATFRDAKKQKVKEDLDHIRDYVQCVAQAAPTPAAGAALIESARMSVKKAPKRTTSDLSARNAGVSGKVLLVARAVAPVATYAWEYSVDQTSWTPIPGTMHTRTEVAGLTPASVHSFRFRALTREGWGDYSQVVSLLVQ